MYYNIDISLKQAKMLVCPRRITNVKTVVNDEDGTTSVYTRCLGNSCMMWIALHDIKDVGHCGLIHHNNDVEEY